MPDPVNPGANRSLLFGFAGWVFTGVPMQARTGKPIPAHCTGAGEKLTKVDGDDRDEPVDLDDALAR
jgi:hypothetical protein